MYKILIKVMIFQERKSDNNGKYSQIHSTTIQTKFHRNEKKKEKIDSPIWSTNVLLKYNIISKITVVTLIRLYIPDVD